MLSQGLICFPPPYLSECEEDEVPKGMNDIKIRVWWGPVWQWDPLPSRKREQLRWRRDDVPASEVPRIPASTPSTPF